MFTDNDDLLALSGVQHYAFCPRQWALIHIEQQWEDNGLTVDGNIMHERCHDEEIREKRGDTLIVRGLRVTSYELGLSGICDIVEFHSDGQGAALFGEEGLWLPIPVEYKRGRKKSGDEDRVQLCAQAMALEEMFCCHLSRGFLFYGETKRREPVSLGGDLRGRTKDIARRMHVDFARGYTPPAKWRSACRSCSCVDICAPELEKKPSVNDYLAEMVYDS